MSPPRNVLCVFRAKYVNCSLCARFFGSPAQEWHMYQLFKPIRILPQISIQRFIRRVSGSPVKQWRKYRLFLSCTYPASNTYSSVYARRFCLNYAFMSTKLFSDDFCRRRSASSERSVVIMADSVFETFTITGTLLLLLAINASPRSN